MRKYISLTQVYREMMGVELPDQPKYHNIGCLNDLKAAYYESAQRKISPKDGNWSFKRQNPADTFHQTFTRNASCRPEREDHPEGCSRGPIL